MLLALLACTSSQPVDLSTHLPDQRLLVGMPVEVQPSTARSSVGEVSEAWELMASIVKEYNQVVGSILLRLERVAEDGPSESDLSGLVQSFGPIEEALLDLSYRLDVVHDEDAGLTTWEVWAWSELLGEDSALRVILGEIQPGSAAGESEGWVDVDVELLAPLFDLDEATGQISLQYGLGTDGSWAEAGLDALYEEESASGLLGFEQDEAGGRVQGEALLELDGEEGSEERVYLLDVSWLPEGSGSAEGAWALVGDPSSGESFVECWDDEKQTTYSLEAGEEEGDPSTCP